MQSTKTTIIFSLALVASAAVLGYFFNQSVNTFRSFDRSIQVKGLSEREVQADTAIWPIRYSVASNELDEIYDSLETQNEKIRVFLLANGFDSSEITFSQPVITDKRAQSYSNYNANDIRFTAIQTVTLYSKFIDTVRDAQSKLVDLGKQGIVFSGDQYSGRTQYMFSGLNEIKPDMIEDATQKAREVATKFAQDSESKLGKIKQARQGQFSITDRDSNTPYIKKVRVVSTIEYYLID